jgi:hypothetical protein
VAKKRVTDEDYSIDASVHSVPFGGVAVRQGVGEMVKRDLVLVRVTAENGTVGYGESHMGLNGTHRSRAKCPADSSGRRHLGRHPV